MAWTERTELLIGKDALKLLERAHVAVFGLGGVGSYACEALARAGIGALSLIDADTYEETNLNRQLYATRSTLSRNKTDVARERILDINPECRVETHTLFWGNDTACCLDFSSFSYVADCIDTVSSKILIAEKCLKSNIPLLSCMGTGNKLEPSRLLISDISKTSVCPLARVMRRELRNRGINHLKVLFSTETPVKTAESARIPGSISFVPSCAGLMIAGEIIRDILRIAPR